MDDVAWALITTELNSILVPVSPDSESMTYRLFSGNGKPRRKRLLPLRKRALPILVLLATSLIAAAHEVDELRHRVVADATHRLAMHARQLGWDQYEHQIEAWLPRSAADLEPCRGVLTASPSRTDAPYWGRVPYTLSCSDPVWRLRGRAEVAVWLKVWTARHDIARNRPLERTDMVLKRTAIDRLHGGFTTRQDELLGFRTQRRIRAGQPIPPGLLAAQVLVRKGDNVVIRANAAGMLATMSGTALADGALHQEVKVRNHSSDKVISAWVVERGVVETRF